MECVYSNEGHCVFMCYFEFSLYKKQQSFSLNQILLHQIGSRRKCKCSILRFCNFFLFFFCFHFKIYHNIALCQGRKTMLWLSYGGQQYCIIYATRIIANMQTESAMTGKGIEYFNCKLNFSKENHVKILCKKIFLGEIAKLKYWYFFYV